MGLVDKVIRVLIAIVFTILYFSKIVEGTLGIVLLVLAAVFILTSIIGFCPIYFPLNLSTHKKK